jgi:hypothetical protein
MSQFRREICRVQAQSGLTGLSFHSDALIGSDEPQSQANPKDWNEGREARRGRHASC